MAYINYGNKRFLIVDNIKPSRDALKQFALSLNASRIDSTLYPSDVVAMCKNIAYDIIFLGYDLGEDQKNGQQLLEELRTSDAITRQCIVIIITAESSQAMVLAALEHKPDDYLTKPYTVNELTKRLDRCTHKKDSMSAIYQALDNSNHKKTIRLCNEALEKGTSYRLECLGIISRQYFELEQFKLAEKIFLSNQDKPNCQWANIGLGKIALNENKIPSAIHLFNQVKQHYPSYLDTYDWLSEAYQALEEFQKAEDVLEQALFISPRSVARLKCYAELCLNNEHYEKASDAFLQTTDLAYNSIHHHPDNALKFASSLAEYSSEISVHLAKRLNNKAFKALASMTKEFNQVELKIQSNLLSACLFKNINESRSATEMYSQAKKLLDKSQDTIAPLSLIEMCKSLLKLNEFNSAQQLVTSLIERCADDLDIMTQIDKLSDSSLGELDKSKAQQALNVAASLYKNKDYTSAIKKLRRALKLYPEHLGIKLNLTQALLVAYESNPNAKNNLNQAGTIISSLNQSVRNKNTNLRYIKLKDKFEQLKAG